MNASRTELGAKIGTATQLQGVVRTMRAVAASSITQYDRAVRALAGYAADVELAIGLCLPQPVPRDGPARAPGAARVIVFGSDQGLVGPFNEGLAERVVAELAVLGAEPVQIWAVGDRMATRLADAGWPVQHTFDVPNSVEAVAPLVSRIQIATEQPLRSGELPALHVFHQQPQAAGGHAPVHDQLLPLDAAWMQEIAAKAPHTGTLAEVVGGVEASLRLLIGEFLFTRLVRACAESLASENAARLETMRRAEQNISDLLRDLRGEFHRNRQQAIDEELFDLLAGDAFGPGPDG